MASQWPSDEKWKKEQTDILKCALSLSLLPISRVKDGLDGIKGKIELMSQENVITDCLKRFHLYIATEWEDKMQYISEPNEDFDIYFQVYLRQFHNELNDNKMHLMIFFGSYNTKFIKSPIYTEKRKKFTDLIFNFFQIYSITEKIAQLIEPLKSAWTRVVTYNDALCMRDAMVAFSKE